MFDIIVVSHGGLAKGLVATSELIMGAGSRVWAYGLQPGADLAAFENAVHGRIASCLQQGREVLVLSDLPHGTPFNLIVKRALDRSVVHLTGANLALLLEARARQADPTVTATSWVDGLVELARGSTFDVAELLTSLEKEE